MKIFLLLGAIVIIALIFKACVSWDTSTDNTSRPPFDPDRYPLRENDKLIVVSNITQDVVGAITKFCNIYNQQDYAALPRLFEVKQGTYAITFPYDIDFVTFCFAVNFLKYPTDIKWNADVSAWATTRQGDEWITEKSVNKQVMLYLAGDDKEYDNVFLTTNDNIGYKLGFAGGKEVQLLPAAKEKYILPSVNYKSIQALEHEDFK